MTGCWTAWWPSSGTTTETVWSPFHDVGDLLREHRARFVPAVGDQLDRAAAISKRLRRDRELAFSVANSSRAYDDAAWILGLAEATIGQDRR